MKSCLCFGVWKAAGSEWQETSLVIPFPPNSHTALGKTLSSLGCSFLIKQVAQDPKLSPRCTQFPPCGKRQKEGGRHRSLVSTVLT